MTGAWSLTTYLFPLENFFLAWMALTPQYFFFNSSSDGWHGLIIGFGGRRLLDNSGAIFAFNNGHMLDYCGSSKLDLGFFNIPIPPIFHLTSSL